MSQKEIQLVSRISNQNIYRKRIQKNKGAFFYTEKKKTR